MIKEHNIETGEIIEREFTAEELAQLEKDQLDAQELAALKTEQAAAKSALLSKLGITADEAKLLLS